MKLCVATFVNQTVCKANSWEIRRCFPQHSNQTTNLCNEDNTCSGCSCIGLCVNADYAGELSLPSSRLCYLNSPMEPECRVHITSQTSISRVHRAMPACSAIWYTASLVSSSRCCIACTKASFRCTTSWARACIRPTSLCHGVLVSDTLQLMHTYRSSLLVRCSSSSGLPCNDVYFKMLHSSVVTTQPCHRIVYRIRRQTPVQCARDLRWPAAIALRSNRNYLQTAVPLICCMIVESWL